MNRFFREDLDGFGPWGENLKGREAFSMKIRWDISSKKKGRKERKRAVAQLDKEWRGKGG